MASVIAETVGSGQNSDRSSDSPLQSSSPRRFTELDGLRGIAAFVVFVSHAVDFFPRSSPVDRIHDSRISFLWDGHASVNLFFVLSGFVLSLPFTGLRTLGYSSFITKRVFRLYPAYWVALSLALLFRMFHDPNAMTYLSMWAQSFWNTPVSRLQAFDHLVMIGPKIDAELLDPVIWTMVAEMKMSLLVPIVIWMMKLRAEIGWKLLITSAIMLIGLKVQPLNLLFHFALGILLAFQWKQLSKWFETLARPMRFLIFAVGIILWGNRFALQIFPDKISEYLGALGSAILIIAVISDVKLAAVPKSKFSIFLGHTSYSFYLIHVPALLFFTSLIGPTDDRGLLICILISLVFSYGLAWPMYKLIEIPCQDLGRRISAKFPARAAKAVTV